jgi:hypothetical protein
MIKGILDYRPQFTVPVLLLGGLAPISPLRRGAGRSCGRPMTRAAPKSPVPRFWQARAAAHRIRRGGIEGVVPSQSC